jgi:UDP-glucose 4-epimerase
MLRDYLHVVDLAVYIIKDISEKHGANSLKVPSGFGTERAIDVPELLFTLDESREGALQPCITTRKEHLAERQC